ncbi:hypothetical protein PT974_06419 [Cladobotryum mycophilum]|uniref:Uncharacterized protein n=1 Tax=Cladobotryum mycophilum TaxID=491253 RepID=A0ABR0SLF4_9HYPO
MRSSSDMFKILQNSPLADSLLFIPIYHLFPIALVIIKVHESLKELAHISGLALLNHTTTVVTVESISTSLKPNVDIARDADPDVNTTQLLTFGLLAVFFGFCLGIAVFDMFRKYRSGELRDDARGARDLSVNIVKGTGKGLAKLFKNTWHWVTRHFTKPKHQSKDIGTVQEKSVESMAIIKRLAAKSGTGVVPMTSVAVVEIDTENDTVIETNIQVIVTPPSPMIDSAEKVDAGPEGGDTAETAPAEDAPDLELPESRPSSLYSIDVSAIDRDFDAMPSA